MRGYAVRSTIGPMVFINVPTDTTPAVQQDPWDKVLTDGHASLVRARRLFRYLPSAPRCKVCNNPFGGPAGRVLAAAGFSPSRKNPNLCRSGVAMSCPPGGAEVDIAILFADVRGSTALGGAALRPTSPHCSTGSTSRRRGLFCGTTR